MRSLALLPMLLIAAGLRAQSGPHVFASDPRLKAPIAMREKIVSLEDFAAHLQKLTSVHFTAAPNIADRKITAIFHNRPVAEVMGAIQSAMFMEWKKVGDGYRLVLPMAVERDEQAIFEAQTRALRSALLDGLKRFAQLPDFPQDEIMRRRKKLNAEIAKLQQDSSAEAPSKLEDLRRQLSDLVSYPLIALCKSCSGDLPGVVSSLLEGKTVCASTRDYPSMPKLQGFMDHVLQTMPDATEAFVLLHFNFGSNSVVGEIVISSGSTPGNTHTFMSPFKPRAKVEDLPSSKLLQRLAKWSGERDPSLLAKPVKAEGREEEAPGYGVAEFTVAEHLAYLADRADIPVIGDAFRIYCSRAQYRAEATVQAYLEGLKTSHVGSDTNGSPMEYYSAQNGWLFVRHQAYWMRLALEIPESVLKPIEADAQSAGYPSTDDYARFLSNLTVGEAQDLKYNPWSYVLRFDAAPIQMAYGSLKLWSTLTADEAAKARSGGLPLVELTPDQLAIVRDDWADKMWKGQLSVEEWISLSSRNGFRAANPILTCESREFGAAAADDSTTPRGRVARGPTEQVNFTYKMSTNKQLMDLYVTRKSHPLP